MPKLTPLLVLGLAPLSGSALAAGPSFTPLGTLGSDAASSAAAISDDGTTVVGTSGNAAFRWTATGGMIGLGTNLGAATGVSADGSVVVGNAASGVQGYRWTSTATTMFGTIDADTLALKVNGVSPDGRSVLGTRTVREWIEAVGGWVNGQYVVRIPGHYASVSKGSTWSASGTLANTIGSSMFAASYDGSVLVGSAFDKFAFRYRPGTGTMLPVPPPVLFGSSLSSSAVDVSADGAIAVGRTTAVPGLATLWDAADAYLILGDLPGGAEDSRANAVSPDGHVVVGQGTAAEGKRAFIWTRDYGMQDLRDVLSANGLAGELAGWTLTDATDVTVDASGTAIVVGTGTDPLGRQRAFVAAVPEPASMLALSLGGLALLRRRRRA